MAEVLVEFPNPVVAKNGRRYVARACGGPADYGRWQGWIEFVPVDEEGPVLRSPRETTQPNREDTAYWASGLTLVYLEGALQRALQPIPKRPAAAARPAPAYDLPAPDFAAPRAPGVRESILNPFSIYEKSEVLLRKQLAALSSWHLVGIIEHYGLAKTQTDLNSFTHPTLVELIVSGVKRPDAATIEE